MTDCFRGLCGSGLDLRRVVSLFLLACAVLLGVGSARAQKRAQASDSLSTLSPGAHRTVSQLSSLNSIAAADWKFHVGDVAHGEAPGLDDSGWQTVTEKSHAPTDAVWYRRWIEVPKTLNGYDLSGARIWFQFAAYANGPMPEIIYFNGRRVAMGDDLEPIVLFDHAQPGERVLVAVKLLHTVDQKTFARAVVSIEFSAARPNPNDLLQEILSANALLPSLGPSAAAVRQGIEAASAAVDLQALGAGAAAGFRCVTGARAGGAGKNQGRFAADFHSTDREIRTLMRRGCGLGRKRCRWCTTLFRRRCS